METVKVHQHGKLLEFTLLLEDGLNLTTENYLKISSYYEVQVVYRDSRLTNFSGVRALANSTLIIRNIAYSNNRLVYTTALPSTIDYHKSFQIVFPVTMMSSQNVK